MTGLTSDQSSFLSERLLRELVFTDERIDEQENVIQDATGAERVQAEKVLRGLRRWAALYLTALDRLRDGDPRCHLCDAPIGFDRLAIHLLTNTCERCGERLTVGPHHRDSPMGDNHDDRVTAT